MALSENERIQVFNLTQGRCFYCCRELVYHAYRLFTERGAWVVDCFIPIVKGGADGPSNWTPCCLACSHRKGESFPWEFNPERFRIDVWELEAYLKDMIKPMGFENIKETGDDFGRKGHHLRQKNPGGR